MSVIKLSNVSKIYGLGDATTVAVDDVDLSIKKGEFVAIMGPSGSGKSTLMNIIGLLDTPSNGEYDLDSSPVSRLSQNARSKIRREKIGFVFQSFNLLPRMTVIENVALPLTYSGISHVDRLERASEILKELDLREKEYYRPTQLSGGQAQRVAVARALANKPSIILADEPTGNLDTKSSENIMELLKDLHSKGNTIIMVTHNPDLARYAQRELHIVDGKIAKDTSTAASTKKQSKKKASKKPKSKKTKKKGKK